MRRERARVWEAVAAGVFASGLLCGCGSKHGATQVPSPQEPLEGASVSSAPRVALSGFVVLPGGVRLHARPDAGAAFVQLPSASTSDPMHRRLVAFEVVGGTGPWVEIRNLLSTDWAAHCVSGSALLSGLRVTAWVRRDELIPVLQRPSTQRDDAGATIRFSPGVPVGEGGGIVPALSPTRKLLAVDPTLVGLSYRPSTYTSPVVRVRSPRDAPLRFDGAEVHYGQFEGADVLLEEEGGGVWTYGTAVFAVEQRNAAQWITVGTRCMRFEVADSAALHAHKTPEPAGPDGVLGGIASNIDPAESFGARTQKTMRVPPGAIVYWTDGTIAGSVHESLSVQDPVKQRGALTCVSVGWSLFGARFCFEPNVIQIEPAPAPPRQW